MPPQAHIDPAIFDTAVFAAVQRLTPPQRLATYLHDLDQQFRVVLSSPANDPDLHDRAHKIVSQAGMLGLTRMSDCAATLENVHRLGGDRTEALANCRAAAEDVQLHAIPAVADSAG